MNIICLFIGITSSNVENIVVSSAEDNDRSKITSLDLIEPFET